MASVLIILLPYLLLFYVLDSIRLVRKNHLLFFSYLGRRFHPRSSGFYLPGISPVGLTVHAHCNPVCCFSGGISQCNENCSSHARLGSAAPALLPFESIESIAVEHTFVRVNGEVWNRFPSHRSASHFVTLVKRMKSVPGEEQDVRIAASVRNSFNIERLERLKKLYGKLFLPVNLLSATLFGLLFILLPLCLFTDLSMYIRLGGLVLGLLFIYTFALLYSYFVYRKIYRTSRRRGLLFILMQVFSPMSAVHSLNHLATDLYYRFDYLAIAVVLLSKEQFSTMAASELRKIKHAFKASGPLELREYWMLREKEIVQLVNQVGIEEHELMAPPQQEDPLAVGFCPVCLTEYREGVMECSDCAIALHKFRNNRNV